MAPPEDLRPSESEGFFSSYQLLTLYFPAFIFALGYSIATPAIPVFAKSFDTGFGVASLVIVVLLSADCSLPCRPAFSSIAWGAARFLSPDRCSWRYRPCSSPWRTLSWSFYFIV
jgi:hypothetical protein